MVGEVLSDKYFRDFINIVGLGKPFFVYGLVRQSLTMKIIVR